MVATRGHAELDAADLVGVRAALAAGASPGASLAEAGEGALGGVARSVRLGRSLKQEAAAVDTGDLAADLLVRALAVVEQAGHGAGEAVAQSMRAIRDGAALDQLLRVRTAQARVTARVLALIPVAAWLLLVMVEPHALRFYTTGLGIALGALALTLAAAGRWWSSRLVRGAERAAAAADPLCPPRTPLEPGRALACGLPVLVGGWVLAGPVAGLLCGVAAGCALAWPRQQGPPPDILSGGAAEAVELVGIGVAAGLPAPTAVEVVSEVAPPTARVALSGAARRLRGGWAPEAAFDGSGLAPLGRVLGSADRWGAPCAEALQELAADLRAARRSAAEEAAERVQVALVFPTTLLTLPAFITAVVPPLLWTAFVGGVGPT